MTTVKKAKRYYWYLNGVSSRDLVIAVLTPAGKEVFRKTIKNGSFTEKLLPSLATFFRSNKNYLPQGIIVAQGAGSYSQLRLICATVNALAFAWGIKLATVSKPVLKIKAPVEYKWQKIIWPKYKGPGVG